MGKKKKRSLASTVQLQTYVQKSLKNEQSIEDGRRIRHQGMDLGGNVTLLLSHH
ncbi:hypothetical protein TorRG33x02_129250, partial [Trema orientale]